MQNPAEETVEHSETTIIERPVERVWALAGDPRAWPAWAPDIRDVEVSPAGALAPGSTVRLRTRGSESHATVTEFVEHRAFGFRAAEPRYDFFESITLNPSGARTQVTLTMGFAPKGPVFSALALLARPFKRWLLGSPLRKDLEALRGAVERGD